MALLWEVGQHQKVVFVVYANDVGQEQGELLIHENSKFLYNKWQPLNV